jgi:tRNA(fMet)-specific endonuclease VapC
MLDTNIISDLVRNPQGKAAKRIAKVGENNICTSIVVASPSSPPILPSSNESAG